MGIRFRKTISLGKGARVNISKSGPSLSLGPRGASVSVGKRGTYVNLGIPGTGVSMRTKVGGSSGRRPRKPSSRSSNSVPVKKASASSSGGGRIVNDRPVGVRLSKAGEFVFVDGKTGVVIDDGDSIRALKRRSDVKEKMASLKKAQRSIWHGIQEKSDEASREFVDIYKLSPQLVSAESLMGTLSSLRQETYVRRPFPDPIPTREDVRRLLYAQAEQVVKGLFGKSKKMDEFVSSNFASYSTAVVANWDARRLAFEKSEDEAEANANALFAEDYERKRKSIEQRLVDDDGVVVGLVEEWLTGLTIPAEVSASIDYSGGVLFLDLDLPEIEDLPPTTTKQLKSGQVKVVNKSQKQLKEEYATCVTGLAFFIASSLLNLNVNISEVWISGYTQRRNKEGDIVDECIYSVKFPRERFEHLVIKDPIASFDDFESRMKLSSAYTFGKIKPYGPSET